MTQQQTFRCQECGGEFPTAAALDAHSHQEHGMHQEASGFRCEACDGEFPTQEALRAHAQAEHARR